MKNLISWDEYFLKMGILFDLLTNVLKRLSSDTNSWEEDFNSVIIITWEVFPYKQELN